MLLHRLAVDDGNQASQGFASSAAVSKSLRGMNLSGPLMQTGMVMTQVSLWRCQRVHERPLPRCKEFLGSGGMRETFVTAT